MHKKILTLLLSTLLTVVLLPIFGSFNSVNAYDKNSYYEYFTSNMYEVDRITNSGKFELVQGFDDFDSAKNKMKTNADYVVRCRSGYSPTRIVAMNSGLAYSYPRGSSSTQNIYERYGDGMGNYTSTYISQRYEMTYVDTPYMSSKSTFEGQGYVEVIMNGFKGYADVEYTDLIPSKFIDNGLPIYIGGPYSSSSIDPYKVVVVPNYFVVKQNGNYNDLEFHYHIGYPDSNGYSQEYTLKVDNAVNYTFMQAGTKYFSDDGYNFYTDYKKNTLVGTCYNYYQFLPIRTKTSIPGSVLDSFLSYMGHSDSVMRGNGNDFVNLGDEYGCNGALIYALACQESAYGTSGYARNRNNLFGWSAYDSDPDNASYFSSVYQAIKEHMGRNLRMYSDYTDWRYNGTYVGNKGSGFNLKYASDPYWGIKIASIYYNLDKYANNNNGNLTDHNRWRIGLIKNFGAGIYSNEACTSMLSSANYSSTRQVANTVNIVDETSNSYLIQFSNPRNKQTGEVYKDVDGIIGYSWSGSRAYVKKSDVQLLNVKEVTPEPEKPQDLTYDPLTTVDYIELTDSTLKISGIGIVTCKNMDDTNAVTHKILLKSFDGTKTYTFDAENTETSFSINDGFNYKYGGYSANIDFSDLDINSYTLELETIVGDHDLTKSLCATKPAYRRNCSIANNISYNFTANQLYSYRLELDIEDTPVDYSNINKPYERSSLCSYNTISINENGLFEIDGFGMVYYLDYDNLDNIDYKLYLINSSSNYKTIDLENYELDQSIIDIFDLENNIKYIAFKASANIDELELEEGSYKLLLEMKNTVSNTTYVDYAEFTNRSNRKGFDVTYNNKNYKLVTNPARYHLQLEVSNAE